MPFFEFVGNRALSTSRKTTYPYNHSRHLTAPFLFAPRALYNTIYFFARDILFSLDETTISEMTGECHREKEDTG